MPINMNEYFTRSPNVLPIGFVVCPVEELDFFSVGGNDNWHPKISYNDMYKGYAGFIAIRKKRTKICL